MIQSIYDFTIGISYDVLCDLKNRLTVTLVPTGHRYKLISSVTRYLMSRGIFFADTSLAALIMICRPQFLTTVECQMHERAVNQMLPQFLSCRHTVNEII